MAALAENDNPLLNNVTCLWKSLNLVVSKVAAVFSITVFSYTASLSSRAV